MYGERLHLAPPFRRRLVEVPFGLHHPLWIEDPDFDLDFHIRRHRAAVARHGEQLADARGGDRRPAARPPPAAVGGVGHRGARGRQHRRAHQGPPRRHRRRVGQRDDASPCSTSSPRAADVRARQAWEPDRVPTDVELVGYAMPSLARQPVRLVVVAWAHALRRRSTLTRRNRQPDIAPPPAPFARPAHVVQPRRLSAPLVRDDDAVARRREGGEEQLRHDGERRRAWRCAPASLRGVPR